MNKLKIKLDGEVYEVLQIIFLPYYTDPWNEENGETAYIEYGRDYKLHGQLYIGIEDIDFTKETILNWDGECNPV